MLLCAKAVLRLTESTTAQMKQRHLQTLTAGYQPSFSTRNKHFGNLQHLSRTSGFTGATVNC